MISFHQKHNTIGDMIFNTVPYEKSSFCAHFHKSYELIYVISGEFHCILDGNKYTFREGDIALIQPYRIHSWHIPEGRAHICVFSEGYVKSFTKLLGNRRSAEPTFACSEAAKNYYREVIVNGYPHYFDMPAPKNPLDIKSALYAVLSEYLKNATLTEYAGDLGEKLSTEILDYIAENFRDDLSLTEIASALGYSYQHISRVFNRRINSTFKDFLNFYRFEYARQLLLESDLPIAEVASEAGFQSIRNFNLVCMRLSGKTPKEIRAGK